MAWAPPQVFDDYRVIRPLGAGAMGQVFLAHDLALDRQVAIKFVSAPDSAQARERFFVEARAVARLQHPNVLSVHRVGEVDGRPYFVSEFLRGTVLKALPLPVPEATLLDYAIGLARGLAAAHRKGVLHRDLKPGNAMLTEEGLIKLLDFGLAKLPDEHEAPRASSVNASAPPPLVERSAGDDTLPSAAAPLAPSAPTEEEGSKLTQAGALLGSPLYMSPEAWRAEVPSPQTDVYSLGVMLYELATGAAPFAQVPVNELAAHVQLHEPAPLQLNDPRFAAVIMRCLARNRLARFPSAESLLEALEGLASRTSRMRAAVPSGNPFRGLAAFTAEDREVFFGRETEARALVERLKSEHFVVVAGDSGVGKSSLCRAGLLPALTDALTVTLTPGRRPLLALVAALAPLLEQDEDTFALALVKDPMSFARTLRRKGLVLFVDQFEELLTLSEASERTEFCEVIAALSLDALAVRLVVAVRADFLGRIAGLPRVGDQLNRALTFVRPLSVEQLRVAITAPLLASGLTFESELTVQALVTSASRNAGALPLLQFALAALWERRDVTRQQIPASALTQLGGLEGCLTRHADSVLASLPRAQALAARGVFSRLVTAEGTAAKIAGSELSLSDDGRLALDALVRGRLVLAREAPERNDSEFQIAHEALIDRWDTLRDWLEGDAHQRAIRARLERATAEWQRLGQPADSLWNARQLLEAGSLELSLSAHEQAFLVASRRAARFARFIRVGAAVALPALLALATVPFFKVKYDAERTREVYRQVAQSAATEAIDHAGPALQARQQAFSRFDAHAADAEELWSNALIATREAQARFAQAQRAFDRALELDATNPALQREAATLSQHAIQFTERLVPGREATELRQALAKRSPEALAALQATVTVTLRTTPSGAQLSYQRLHLESSRWVADPEVPLGPSPQTIELVPGSLIFLARLTGSSLVRAPVLLEQGAEPLEVTLPFATQVPEGFVYVPPGNFLVGSADEDLRKSWLNAEPLHRRTTGAYVIARHETTFAEWITFLRALPPSERRVRTPNVQAFNKVVLEQQRDGRFRLSLEPASIAYTALEGEAIHYAKRASRATQDWLKMPVSAITFDDARAYTAWLASSGRVPGARLCTDDEWERAGRGADGRSFPSSEKVAPDDLDQDITYGREPGGYGPDEVGSHPNSTSPFGVDDLSGNVWEWVASNTMPRKAVLRGGCWYMGDISSLLTNREESTENHKDPLLGLRVCADAQLVAGTVTPLTDHRDGAAP